MMRLAVFAMLIAFPACAADVALILTEPEQREMVQVLDAAAKAEGIKMATPVSHLWEKLKMAPAVKEVTGDKEAAPQ